jgi:2-polyprenyl-6-methoxyphenol hydroxylase-like FAD-dependent oxidoreductase
MTGERIDTVPVLIAGGGPVGLSTALLLARLGVRSTLVERRQTTSSLPKARLVNTRSMEVFRQCGIESAIRTAGLPPSRARFLIRARSVAGEEIDRREATFTQGAQALHSPTTACTCPQNHLEPVLLSTVRDRHLTEILFEHELTAFLQDANGVTATIVDRAKGEERQIRAGYLVGADGAHSLTRQILGINMDGQTGLGHNVLIHFRADLTRWLEHRPPYMVLIDGPQGPGPLLAVDGSDEWLYMSVFDPASGRRAEDYTSERCLAIVREVLGDGDVPVELLGSAPWTANARVAQHYAKGRVFLAGDAAHEVTPSGGFGMNTGVQDAHNLAWKLSAVLGGWAAPSLLETYDAERRPVGQAVVAQSVRNRAETAAAVRQGARHADGAAHGTASGTSEGAGVRPRTPQLLNEWGLIFGTAYASDAVVPDKTSPPEVDDPVTDYVPTARPGHRAPHVWLDRSGQRISTLDLFGDGFVLMTGPSGGGWQAAAQRAFRKRGVPIATHVIGDGCELQGFGGAWQEAYAVQADGAVLVRPDGHVAWRCRTTHVDPMGELERVSAALLFASDAGPGRSA